MFTNQITISICQQYKVIVDCYWYSLILKCLYKALGKTEGAIKNGQSRDTGNIILSYKPITNTAWVRTRLCKLQQRVHSTRSRK
jgi:hypothetical protein